MGARLEGARLVAGRRKRPRLETSRRQTRTVRHPSIQRRPLPSLRRPQRPGSPPNRFCPYIIRSSRYIRSRGRFSRRKRSFSSSVWANLSSSSMLGLTRKRLKTAAPVQFWMISDRSLSSLARARMSRASLDNQRLQTVHIFSTWPRHVDTTRSPIHVQPGNERSVPLRHVRSSRAPVIFLKTSSGIWSKTSCA